MRREAKPDLFGQRVTTNKDMARSKTDGLGVIDSIAHVIQATRQVTNGEKLSCDTLRRDIPDSVRINSWREEALFVARELNLDVTIHVNGSVVQTYMSVHDQEPNEPLVGKEVCHDKPKSKKTHDVRGLNGNWKGKFYRNGLVSPRSSNN